MVFDDSERERFYFDRREFEPVDPNECPECGGEKDEDSELCEECQEALDAEEEGGGGVMERRFEMSPAYDKRSEGYGQGAATMRFYVIGPKGAVQFVCMTGWYPKIVKPTTFDDWSDWRGLSIAKMEPYDSPMPSDLGYHSPTPMYEGQGLRQEHCPIINGPCYYDGSGLNAHKPFSILIHEGSERLWEFLEHYYASTFGDEGK